MYLDPRRRVSQQPPGTLRESGREHETVGTVGNGRHEILQRGTQSREVLERPQLQNFIEQEGGRRAIQRVRRLQERERRAERRARVRRRVKGRRRAVEKKRRSGNGRTVEALRRCRHTLHVDVLTLLGPGVVAKAQEQPGAAATATANDQRHG
jgi:hypothetical protein